MEEIAVRKNIYDYIRVFACIGVIGIHCTGKEVYDFNEGGMIADYILHSFFCISLPIFFLLSGALLLSNKRQETVAKFYWNRFIKIVIPFFIYSLFYALLVNNGFDIWDCFEPNTWKICIQNFWSGVIGSLETYQVVHLWFMYSMIGIYLVVPFLRIMLQNMDEEELKSLGILIIFMRCLVNYYPILSGRNIGIDYIFNGWVLYVILGYIIMQPVMSKFYKYIEIVGLVSFLASMIVFAFFPQYVSKNFYDLAPHMIFQSCGLYLFLYCQDKRICRVGILNSIMRFLSKYTFSIYMIHMYVLGKIEGKGIIERVADNLIIREFIYIGITFVVSLIMVLIIDNTIVKVIQMCIMKLSIGIKKILAFWKNRSDIKEK